MLILDPLSPLPSPTKKKTNKTFHLSRLDFFVSIASLLFSSSLLSFPFYFLPPLPPLPRSLFLSSPLPSSLPPLLPSIFQRTMLRKCAKLFVLSSCHDRSISEMVKAKKKKNIQILPDITWYYLRVFLIFFFFFYCLWLISTC